LHQVYPNEVFDGLLFNAETKAAPSMLFSVLYFPFLFMLAQGYFKAIVFNFLN
jgi:hypothetical protein